MCLVEMYDEPVSLTADGEDCGTRVYEDEWPLDEAF